MPKVELTSLVSKAASGLLEDDSSSGTSLDVPLPPIIDDDVGAQRKPADVVEQPAEFPDRELLTVEYGAGGLVNTRSSGTMTQYGVKQIKRETRITNVCQIHIIYIYIYKVVWIDWV